MCLCVCMYVCKCVYVCIYVCLCVCVCAYVYKCVYVCMHWCMAISIYCLYVGFDYTYIDLNALAQGIFGTMHTITFSPFLRCQKTTTVTHINILYFICSGTQPIPTTTSGAPITTSEPRTTTVFLSRMTTSLGKLKHSKPQSQTSWDTYMLALRFVF